MKECLYAWYPPARDVWKRNEPDSYTKECLYRHWQTRYSDRTPTLTPAQSVTAAIHTQAPAAAEAEASFHVDAIDPSPRGNSSASRPCPPAYAADASGADLKTEMTDGSKQPSGTTVGPGHGRVGTSRKQWADRLPETACTVFPSSSPYQHQLQQQQQQQLREHPTVATTGRDRTQGQLQEHIHHDAAHQTLISDQQKTTNTTTIVAAEIAESPTTRSDAEKRVTSVVARMRSLSARPSIPPRPPATQRSVQSAAPFRPPVTVDQQFRQTADGCSSTLNVEAPVRRRFQHRPKAPVQSTYTSSEEFTGVDEPLDYDEQLKKYGWKMEIPGDPFNLKRPCIRKRRPASVVCSIPVVSPLAPRTHADSSETFFYTTQPRQVLSFTVNPDWASEMLITRRLELQKRNGGKPAYRYRDFSFVY